MAAKKILITGGTGFIGKTLVPALLNEKYSLYLFTREKSLSNQKNKIYINDLNEIDKIKPDIIINLAGETIGKKWTEGYKKQLLMSRLSITGALVDYMKRSKIKPQLFISGSAVGYYGTDPEELFTEKNINPHPTKAFASKLCYEWEEKASEAIKLDIRTVFLRIGPVLGKDGGMLAKLLPSFSFGLGSQLGDGKQWLSWIDRDDLVQLILFIIKNEEIRGSINATSPNPIINKDFSIALAKALKKPIFLKMPSFLIKLIFGEMGQEIMLEGQKVFPEKALANGFNFAHPTIDKSLEKIFPQ